MQETSVNLNRDLGTFGLFQTKTALGQLDQQRNVAVHDPELALHPPGDHHLGPPGPNLLLRRYDMDLDRAHLGGFHLLARLDRLFDAAHQEERLLGQVVVLALA